MLDLKGFENWLRRTGKRDATIYAWIQQLKKLPPEIPSDVEEEDIVKINNWLDVNYPLARDEKHASFGSTYQLIAAIRAYLVYVDREDLRERIKYPKGKMPRRLKVLSEQDIEKLFRAIEEIEDRERREKTRLMVRLLLETGMRRSEIANLKPGWVDWNESKITIPKEVAKGKVDRNVYFSDTTKRLMLEWVDKKGLKPSENFWGWRDKYFIPSGQVRWYLDYVVKKAKLPSWVTPHVFRHTYASRLIKRNVNLRIIQTLLGHQSISSTEIYTHLDEQKIREGARKAFVE